MENKIIKKYIDTGFGFPVTMRNAPMVLARGAWTPDINYRELAQVVMQKLSQTHGRLTGDQVKFVRLELKMTMEQFAARLGVTHPAVVKWEKRKEKPTGMSWSTEKDLRLTIGRYLNGTGPKAAQEFATLYDELAAQSAMRMDSRSERIEVDYSE